MPFFQLRLRTLLIWVAILAVICAMAAAVIKLAVGLEMMYGPNGTLDQWKAEGVRLWKESHPGEPYPANAPTS
jgi:hypothetical protein